MQMKQNKLLRLLGQKQKHSDAQSTALSACKTAAQEDMLRSSQNMNSSQNQADTQHSQSSKQERAVRDFSLNLWQSNEQTPQKKSGDLRCLSSRLGQSMSARHQSPSDTCSMIGTFLKPPQ